jgi:RNA polymerase sigma-70 factor (ECF subfamily)
VSARIDEWLGAAGVRWPELSLDAEVLTRHLEQLGIDIGAEQPHAVDIVLACACSLGQRDALDVFERELVPVIAKAVRRIDDALVDEAIQATRERLLVGPTPRIAEYSGRGPLTAWVRIAAMRIALNLLRPRRRNVLVDDDAFLDQVAHHTDAERRQIRARYADACADALRVAFSELSARERNLLRMHHLHGLTVDELAPTFRVHRATVARWISSARDHMMARTLAGVSQRLGIPEPEADSILRDLRSRLDISVTRLLAE